ncbi:MAG: hypothetical protein PHH37_11250 [Paludibacter sp.]|nr:hypothetical protein [Paludibacter sp.]
MLTNRKNQGRYCYVPGHILLIILLWFSFATKSEAKTTDSISTYYKNKQFTTYCQLTVNSQEQIMNQVIDDFLHQTKYDLDKLFLWALKGLKLRNEKDQIIVFNFISTKYDEKNDVIMARGDVEIPDLIRFPAISVNSRMTKHLLVGNRTKVNINVLYSDAFLKKTTGIFYLIPVDSRSCIITLETKVEFGWFFDFFITKSTFKNIMEWRFHQLMLNLKQEAEKRQKKQLINN